MKTISVHSERSIRFTRSAALWCHILNQYKYLYPNATFKQMAERYGLSETNARRYYYGVHHRNAGLWGADRGETYNQMRRGACVPVEGLPLTP
jgi:hypothetical protein